MIQKGSIRAKALGGLAVVAIVAAACSSSGASTAPSAAAGPYHIGFANGGGVGNGWRESSICWCDGVRPGLIYPRGLLH